MYTIVIIFFASLFAIIFMIWRKLALIEQRHSLVHHEDVLFELPFLKEAKHVTINGVRKHGYNFLVEIVRAYLRGTNFLKNKYTEIKNNLRERIHASQKHGDKKEISKFLKIVGDYKRKIREITHRVKKEENLN